MRNKGFTLLELLFVMSISMMMTIFIASGYLSYKQYSTVAEFNGNKALLESALTDYYFANCREPVFILPTLSDLKNSGLLPGSFSNNGPFNAPFNYAIDTSIVPGVLVLSVNLSSPNEAAKYKGLLKAQSIDGNSLTWETVLHHSHFDTGSTQYDFQLFFGGVCEPQ
jgi:type II secretory pathway pseudopilin PulG